jgi:ethanolamine permease
MYVMSMAALFRLRRIAPELERPWTAPLYPWLPGLALGLASAALVAMIWFNPRLFALFAGVMSAAVLAAWRRWPIETVPA